MKRGLAILLILIGAIIIATIVFLLLTKSDILLAPGGQTGVRVGVGNAAPQITALDTIPAVALSPAPSTTTVTFTFTARDPNGAADLDDTTAIATFTKIGETTRTDSPCTFLSQAGKSKTFECNVDMIHFDGNGVWDVTVSIDDLLAVQVTDTSTFTVNLLKDITLNPPQIDFPTVAPEQTDIQPTGGQTTTVINRGNYQGTISVISSDLIGETNPAQSIPATSFRVTGNSEAPTVCSTGTPLIAASTQVITSSSLPKGPNDGISNVEDISYCLTLVPDISSQFYSATVAGGNAWTIQI